ncbi:BamA/TamA family outer membrane protein [Prevotella communis]|uniref:translocation and assembly module lipoprotein TamL n=1 Tax=Prevotella communis TaxID=2913614 RepID=UPI001EDB1B89|nr:BamA/TamA family outer membrane protein [Prevotella communis]UKK60780.1 BamA/TamA family outer membrane protein [Prevotella communis]UKK63606.1 BamA/TamA family outer membrane protein [Prevotella communis]
MRNVHFLTSFFLGAMVFFSSCSSTKYVPKDQYLLKSVKVKSESNYHDINTLALRNYVRQMPNSRWFSLYKLPLAVYSLSGRDSTKWINRTLKSMGEAPVVFDSLSSVQTCADLAQQLKNEGFLDAQVRLQVSTKGRKAKVEYLLQPGEPYFVDSIGYATQDTTIARILSQQGASASLLYKGMKFDVSKLDAERKRISTLLSDSGYYRFHKDYITYQADSISHSRLINLTLHLAPYQLPNEEYVPHTRYWMRHINYGSGSPGDNQIHLRQHVLQECTHLHSGSPYSASGLQNTYNHFGRLQAVKYTNITFKQVPDADSLDCQILLQNNKPSTLSFQPEGTNTAGDLGAAASLTYQNRNLFRGSEVLSVQLRGAYEAIRGLEGYSNQNFVEYSAEAKLQFPRFISPFVNRRIRRLVNATSEVSLLYDMQDRPEFHRRLLSAAWRYKWSFPHRKDKFQVDVLDLNYVFMPWISETFHNEYLRNDNNRNAILRYNYEDLFITKIGFGYSITKGNTAFKSNIETSGNLLSLASRMWNAKKDELGHYQVFNIAFAQYVKCDLDLSHVLMIDKNNQLVFHAGLGVAYPYGNSTVMPFEKRYFSGGANSVRGWTVRSLGPGQYKEQDGRINFINQTGDMKLDLNAEYRTYLFWKFNGALFVDAGNIWTIRQYDEQPGGQFSFKDFPRQLAVSYGLGLRLNFDYFILRFDLGMKAVNPAYEAEDDEHYPVLHPNFKRDYAFHFAVGMPF